MNMSGHVTCTATIQSSGVCTVSSGTVITVHFLPAGSGYIIVFVCVVHLLMFGMFLKLPQSRAGQSSITWSGERGKSIYHLS